MGPQQVGSSNPPVYDSASEYQGNDNDDEDIVIRLLSLLNVSRFDNYCEWRDIATSLKNEHGDKYRDAWLKYSRTSPKFELGSALELWDQVAKPDYNGPRLTMRSIHRMAQLDSPHSYAQVVATMIDPKIEECITHGGAGHRLAQIFVLLHGEVFRLHKLNGSNDLPLQRPSLDRVRDWSHKSAPVGHSLYSFRGQGGKHRALSGKFDWGPERHPEETVRNLQQNRIEVAGSQVQVVLADRDLSHARGPKVLREIRYESSSRWI